MLCSSKRVANAGCTFEIVAFVRDPNAVDINEWAVDTDSQGSQKLTTIIPIKSSASPPIKLKMHVESV